MHGLPASWGFIRDLRECVGKTIEVVELTSLDHGYTVNSAWTIRFSDGARAFVAERPTVGTVLMPSEDAMAKSNIFRPEELAEVVAKRMRDRQRRESDREASERRQLEALQKKYAR